jgi:hypothetical protein
LSRNFVFRARNRDQRAAGATGTEISKRFGSYGWTAGVRTRSEQTIGLTKDQVGRGDWPLSLILRTE